MTSGDAGRRDASDRLNHLRIGTKLRITYALFLLPVTFLFYIVYTDVGRDIAVSQREHWGNEYIATLRGVARATDIGDDAARAGRIASLENVDRRLTRLLRIEGMSGPLHDALTKDQPNEVLRATRELIGAVADRSGLTLDTDVDSFYLQDVITQTLPRLSDYLRRLSDSLAAAAGQPATAASEAATIFADIGGAQGALDVLSQRLATAYAANPDGRVRTALERVGATAIEASRTTLDQLHQAALTTPALTDDAVTRLLAPALTALFTFGDAAAGELDRLLARRIAMLRETLAGELFTALLLFAAGVAFVIVGLERGAVRPLRRLSHSLQRLTHGDTDAVVDDTARRDEVGDMARATQALKDSMVLARTLKAARDETEQLLAAILDHAPIPIYVRDRQRRYVLVNRCYEEWFGVTLDAIRGRTPDDFMPARGAALTAGLDHETIELGRIAVEHRQLAGIRKAGIDHVLVMQFPVRNADGAVCQVAGFVIDMTDLERTQTALRASEERFHALIDNVNDIISVLGRDLEFIFQSASVTSVLGYSLSENTGRSVLDFVAPDDREPVARALVTVAADPDGLAHLRFRALHKDGSWRDIEATARNAFAVPGIEGLLVSSRDVSEYRRMEAQLAEVRRTEAIGALAGGIAHDFNNLLGAIMGFAGLLAQDLAEGSESYDYAKRIVAVSERGRDIIAQILAFSRAGSVEREPTDLRAIVVGTSDLLRASLPPAIALDVATGEAPAIVLVNGAQIHQVLLNLCVNARDALGDAPGRIAVALDSMSVGDAFHQAISALVGQGVQPAPDGRAQIAVGEIDRDRCYVRITVTDSGAGMSQDTLAHAFDPFFSTKGRHRGTGLGLAVVRSVVASCGGGARIVSAPERGTAIDILLASVEAVPADARPTVVATDLAGHECLLLVDDDQDVLDALAIGLERLGYEVAAVSDPTEALGYFTEDPEAWDAVISDQVMPEVRGLELMARMHRIRPTVPFVLCTGYSDGATERMALDRGASGFFFKPVSAEQIAATIRRLIGSPDA